MMEQLKQQDGQTSVEYGFVLAMVAIVAVLSLALGVIGPATGFFESIPGRLPF